MNGGDLVAEVFVKQGVEHIFTLCGGHIAPILVAAKQRGIRVLDVRDEASAAFAADAVSRLTGSPGVAIVTAGPGVTNTITAVKNAQMAQSPLVVIGGATGTILKGRGSLQDIDQIALVEPHVKWTASVSKVRDLAPAVEQAFDEARLGVPGPTFVECPVDLLYQEHLVRDIYGIGADAPEPRSLGERLMQWYLKWHVDRLFRKSDSQRASARRELPLPRASQHELKSVAKELAKAERPLVLIGSQATLRAPHVDRIAEAVTALGLPVYLSGMARGLLGVDHPLQMRHKRRLALKDADLVLLFGVPNDFRLDYGRHIGKARLVSVNLSLEDLTKNRKPQVPIVADPGHFLLDLENIVGDRDRSTWLHTLRQRDRQRDADIDHQAASEAPEEGDSDTDLINPLHFFRQLDTLLDDDSVLVADGGDFVATAAYTLRPRGPLRWLDPGVFGTLGVGGGFALGAKAVRPESEVWLIWGDGSSAFSLAEFDAFARHGLPIIAIVGNDAGWTQIAREQVEILGDDCATTLARTDYHVVAEGYGGVGLLLERQEDILSVLTEAKSVARSGKPVLVNVLLGKTDFRKGSISM